MNNQIPGHDRAGDVADPDYLRTVERLAHAVVHEALQEGSLVWTTGEDSGQSPLQRSVNALARRLRFGHFQGDGCLDHP
jgi:hypothetical protein